LSRYHQQANLRLHRLKGFDYVADIDRAHTEGMEEQACLDSEHTQHEDEALAHQGGGQVTAVFGRVQYPSLDGQCHRIEILSQIALVSGYRSRDPLNRLTQHELGGLQDFSI